MKRLLIAAGLALALTACNDQFASSGKAMTPIPPRTLALMSEKGMQRSDPILVRLYKKESELEIWKKAQNGEYALLKSYPICRWSGQLGPKTREGDRQAPEGFYTVTPGQMNPNSAYYLSFDTGYPNAFDRAHNRTGSQLMVHGTCSSRGCFAMTDEGIAEVYSLAREAFAGGQKGFQFQAYPFRMTAENLAKFRRDPNMPFWANLKEGSDNFEVTKREPKVAVCGGRYAFNAVGQGCTPDPTLAPVIAQKEADDRQAVAALVAKGVPAVKVVYADGGGHESFRDATMTTSLASDSNFAILDTRPRRNIGDVSRPDALAEGPREIALDETARPTLVAAVSRRGTKPVTAPVVATLDRPAPPARGGRMVLASADPDQPITVAAPVAPEKPFFERMVSNVTGRTEPVVPPVPAPAAATVLVAPAHPVSEPPRSARPNAAKSVPGKAGDANVADAKSEAAKVHPLKPEKADGKTRPARQGATAPARTEIVGKQAGTAALIPGSAPVGPVSSAFRTN